MPHTIEQIWKRILSLEGEQFRTKTGKPFTYQVVGTSIMPSRTEYVIAKSEFEKALNMLPISGPVSISDVVRGPSYVWALLYDSRVRSAKN